MIEERGRIRDAIITQAEIRTGKYGGYIMCRTNKSGLNWVLLPRPYYMAVVADLEGTVPNSRIPEAVLDVLHGKRCEIRLKHIVDQDTYMSSGGLKHMWSGEIRLNRSEGLSDYRLGDGGHG